MAAASIILSENEGSLMPCCSIVLAVAIQCMCTQHMKTTLHNFPRRLQLLVLHMHMHVHAVPRPLVYWTKV